MKSAENIGGGGKPNVGYRSHSAATPARVERIISGKTFVTRCSRSPCRSRKVELMKTRSSFDAGTVQGRTRWTDGRGAVDLEGWGSCGSRYEYTDDESAGRSSCIAPTTPRVWRTRHCRSRRSSIFLPPNHPPTIVTLSDLRPLFARHLIAGFTVMISSRRQHVQ